MKGSLRLQIFHPNQSLFNLITEKYVLSVVGLGSED
jgi:hypothetical protein